MCQSTFLISSVATPKVRLSRAHTSRDRLSHVLRYSISPVFWSKYEKRFCLQNRLLFPRMPPTMTKSTSRLQHLYKIPATYWWIIFILNKNNEMDNHI